MLLVCALALAVVVLVLVAAAGAGFGLCSVLGALFGLVVIKAEDRVRGRRSH